ncbi:MAG: hypothetical protein J6Y13_07780 [Treponema sp.]|nr:hypothetical protein [Treponema sp.]
MPVKLVGALIVAAIAALFTGYNLDNRCDVWLFHTFESVPVAFTIIVSLMAGVLITLPFTLGKNAPRKPTEKDMALLKKAQKKEAKLKLRDEKRAAREAKQAEKAEQAKAEKAKAEAEKTAAAGDAAPAAQPTTVEYHDSSL